MDSSVSYDMKDKNTKKGRKRVVKKKKKHKKHEHTGIVIIFFLSEPHISNKSPSLNHFTCFHIFLLFYLLCFGYYVAILSHPQKKNKICNPKM